MYTLPTPYCAKHKTMGNPTCCKLNHKNCNVCTCLILLAMYRKKETQKLRSVSVKDFLGRGKLKWNRGRRDVFERGEGSWLKGRVNSLIVLASRVFWKVLKYVGMTSGREEEFDFSVVGPFSRKKQRGEGAAGSLVGGWIRLGSSRGGGLRVFHVWITSWGEEEGLQFPCV